MNRNNPSTGFRLWLGEPRCRRLAEIPATVLKRIAWLQR
jgi:hypothetical protein